MKPTAKEKRLLLDMLSLPTAPFAEGYVIAFILNRLPRSRFLHVEQDDVGNLLLRYKRGARRVARPVAFNAHVDHPGFVVAEDAADGCLTARWFGGVEPAYFKNTKVRFYENGRWVRGRIESVSLEKTPGSGRPRRVETVRVSVSGAVSKDAVGMWDLPEPRITGHRVTARGCDDIAGCAAMLASLDRLIAGRKVGEAWFLFTRAEEVGFVGAIAACKNGLLPKRCAVVAVECSSQRVNARLGDGPILRVGDLASTFSPDLTHHCKAIAADLAKKTPAFTYQRKLMDGGTCESTVFCEYGYEATGLCIALGNYHNRDTAREKIAPEFVDLHDWTKMVRWFNALIDRADEFRGKPTGLRKRLEDIHRRHRVLLRRSAARIPRVD